MKKLLIRLLAPPILWFGRSFLGWARLEKIQHIELGATLEDVLSLYGQPADTGPCEDVDGGTSYTFEVGLFHEAVLTTIEGRVAHVTYWSRHAAPNHDLRWVMETYGKEIGWDEVEPGYWYWRRDGRVRLWCSAVPGIGVATKEYFEAKKVYRERAKTA